MDLIPQLGDSPFDLRDRIIRDLPHVLVRRVARGSGQPCEYRKSYKAEGLSNPSYWVHRENEFLLEFTFKKLKHTVELYGFTQTGDAGLTPVVESVITRDAGITIEDWLRIQPRFENGSIQKHPFQSVYAFLKLLRACLSALNEINSHGVIHCDLKEDNICIPYSPYPYTDGLCTPDFERLKLIDFSFSITKDRPLTRPLPVLPTAEHQSRLLKTALTTDLGKGTQGGAIAVQGLDYRVDLFSLGHMASRIYSGGLIAPGMEDTHLLFNEIEALIDRLKGAEWKPLPETPPHSELIAQIDSILGRLPLRGHFRSFEVYDLIEGKSYGHPEQHGPASSTPITPIALGIHEAEPLKAQKPRGKARSGLWVKGTIFSLVALASAMGIYPERYLIEDWVREKLGRPLSPAEQIAQTKTRAEHGYVKAQVEMGRIFANSESPDVNEAIWWFQKAAEQGDTEAELILGRAYIKGIGVKRDVEKAALLLTEAASKDNALAQFYLGGLYFAGIGVAKDPERSFLLFNKSAQKGIPDAQIMLANSYMIGAGVKADPIEANVWIEKAAPPDDPTKYTLSPKSDLSLREYAGVSLGRLINVSGKLKNAWYKLIEDKINTGYYQGKQNGHFFHLAAWRAEILTTP